VVEDSSSYLQIPAIEVAEHIGRNHMEMCRFAGLGDIEYHKLMAALSRIESSGAQRKTSTQPPKPSLLQSGNAQKLLKSLAFDQIDTRHQTIQRAHARTCEWLLTKPEYCDWLDQSKRQQHHGFLWIKGKPGAGKSTLMKFAMEEARQSMEGQTIISFFFNARGDELEKSTVGMYRSLIHQLLQQIPDLSVILGALKSSRHSAEYHSWSLESLKALFETCVQSLGDDSLLCFIDALDECEEYQVREMVSFLDSLGESAVESGTRLQICLSSRHYPKITVKHCIELILERQEGHKQGIVNYIDDELKLGDSKSSEQLRADLQQKAAGVFMWVVLVVGILNKEHDAGRPTRQLRQRLESISGDLHELFRSILRRSDSDHAEFAICVQFILFAARPLSPAELYCAILAGTDPESLSEEDESPTLNSMKAFILNASKGFAETTVSNNQPTVQFIHESIRDFLLKSDGLAIALGGAPWSPAYAHNALKESCLRYIAASDLIINKTGLEIGNLQVRSTLQKARIRNVLQSRLPFLEYATMSALYHSNQANILGFWDGNSGRDFPFRDWIKAWNLLQDYSTSRYDSEVTRPLYILAEHNVCGLLQNHPELRNCFVEGQERYGSPVLAALATGSHEASLLLLNAYAEGHPLQREAMSALCVERKAQGQETDQWTRGCDFSEGRRTLLSYAMQYQDLNLAKYLVLSGVETYSEKPSPAPLEDPELLYYAAKYSKDVLQHVAQLQPAPQSYLGSVFSKGFRNGAPGAGGGTPLHAAADEGNEESARFLLSFSVEVNLVDDSGLTPLSLAAVRGHHGTVQLLLENGATLWQKVDDRLSIFEAFRRHRDYSQFRQVAEMMVLSAEECDNPIERATLLLLNLARVLEPAVFNDVMELSNLLLTKKPADILAENRASTVLHSAACYGNIDIVRICLDAGAGLEDRSIDGQTPLLSALRPFRLDSKSCARARGIIDLLLNRGANVNARDAKGATALMYTCVHDEYSECCLRLLDCPGVDIEATTNEGRTALLVAAQLNSPGIIATLISHKANIDARDKEGKAAIHHAAMNYLSRAIEVLLQNGASIESRCAKGRTPLMCSASASEAQVLVENGASIEALCNEGYTPLLYAAYDHKSDLVRFLLKHGANASARTRETLKSAMDLAVVRTISGGERAKERTLGYLQEFGCT
jgi:ankyrin repeat protein